jgi:hypothetical protein
MDFKTKLEQTNKKLNELQQTDDLGDAKELYEDILDRTDDLEKEINDMAEELDIETVE